ncbi:MAG: pyridoxal-phosphate dependent enzyme [Fervidicoccaceae archaeon]
MEFSFTCPNCGFTSKKPTKDWKCPNCGAPLNAIAKRTPRIRSILGEGNTPSLKVRKENRDLIFKLEYLNPSGSFKDRGTAFTAQYFLAKEKCSSFVEDSSGNTGVSTAAYAAKLGIKANIFAPKTIAPTKAKLLSLLGATLHITETREQAYESALRMIREDSRACYIGHMVNPLFNFGMSFMIEEVLRSWGGGFTDVVLPLSSGTLLLGIYQGFQRNLKRNGFMPKLWAVQPTRINYLRGKAKIVRDASGPSDLADALVVSNPPRLNDIVSAINSSGGGAIIVNDEDIKFGMRALYSMGLLVEPSSAVIWPALEHLEKSGLIGNKVLVPLTGSGLKYIDLINL